MDQMNISITDQLADYVREKVKSGRYNNASEVVRDALRRMEEEDAKVLRLASPTVDDIVSDLTETQIEGIRRKVHAGIEDIRQGRYEVYENAEALQELATTVKQNGRRRLARAEPLK